MALNNYPYTNFHALNTDWIIKVLQDYKAFLEDEQSELQEIRGLIASNLSLIGENQTAINGLDGRITTNATRISELQTALDELGQGNLPQTLIDNILNYVRANLPELLSPYDTTITDLTYNKMNAGLNNPFNARDPDYGTWMSFNDLTRPGTYRINLNEGDSPTTPTHYPSTATLNNGVLVVFNSSLNTNSWGVNTTLQIYAESSNVWYRLYIKATTSGGSSYWTAWNKFPSSSELSNITNSINTLNNDYQLTVEKVDQNTAGIRTLTTQHQNLRTQVNGTISEVNQLHDNIIQLATTKQSTNNGTASQADFNDITEPGSYWIRPDTTTQHAPASSYGLLNVTRSSSSVIVQSFTQTNLRFYQRIFFNNAWSSWQEYTRA